MKSYKAPTKNLRYKTQKEKDTKERGRVVWMFQWDCKPAQCWHWDAMILVFWMLSFKPTFSLSSFTFIKRPFSSSLSAIATELHTLNGWSEVKWKSLSCVRLFVTPWTITHQDWWSPEYSLEGLMLKLKLQYFGHLMGRTDSFEKTLMLGRIGSRRGRGQQRMRGLDGITDMMDMGLGRLWKLLMYREAWHAVIHGVSKSQTRLSYWTELNWTIRSMEFSRTEYWSG